MIFPNPIIPKNFDSLIKKADFSEIVNPSRLAGERLLKLRMDV